MTVVDAQGKPISNTPDVTLEVVSGPGVFPTGKSITFRNGTDIPILDGEAAIEFRSYYAGTTVLRATSPGLPEQRLTITSLGAPAFVPGRSAEFIPAGYVRFIGVMQTAAPQVANIALDRPTNASSMVDNHQSKLAADGDDATYWSAAADAALPQWWESNLEGVYDLSSVSLRFAAKGKYSYEIQVSPDDRMTWKTVASGDAESTVAPVIIPLPAGTRSSGLRVVIDAAPAGVVPGLAEVAIRGSRVK